MASAQLDAALSNILDHHHTLSFFTRALKDQIVALRFLNRQEFPIFPTNLHNHRQLILTNLALKLIKVEMQSPPNNFLLHLEMNPLDQALNVHGPARPRTQARIKQEVILGLHIL